MGLSSKSAGPGYIILNGIRVLNIIGFVSVIAASIVMLVAIKIDNALFFFEAVSHVITLVTSMFLITSELCLFREYFARNWPLLSQSHGFVTLALAMIVLGIDVLGNLNTKAGTPEALGTPFWRMVISSGIIIFVMGWINLFASFVFRDRELGISARAVRSQGAVAVSQTPITGSIGSRTPPAPVLAQSYISNHSTGSPTKSSPNPFRFLSSERRESGLPSYHTAAAGTPARSASNANDRPISPTSKYSRLTTCTKKKVFGNGFFGHQNRQSLAPPLPVNVSGQPVQREMEISAPLNMNPQFAHLVQRPDSALHPSRSTENDPYRWRV